jgi:tetratricopeptide (TPR) repeat protein
LASRNRNLAWLVIAVVPAFAFTGTLTRMYREHERALAAEWAQRAEVARRTRAPDEAVDALQSALRFAPGERGYTFALAGALLDAGRPAEARAYLRTLLELEPGNGPVNLELARLAARDKDTDAAVRHYHNAIEGSWRDAPEQNRRTARMELARYLASVGDMPRVQAELIPLAAELPPDFPDAIEVGELLLRSGSAGRARAVFEALLSEDPRSAAALSGAGRAAFDLGDYPSAARLLTRARAAGDESASVADAAEVARAVIESDPFQRRLSSAERARRARRAYERAVAVAAECPAVEALRPDLDAMKRGVASRTLARDSELIESAMELVYRVEGIVAGSCRAAATPLDTALLLIGRGRFGA